MGDPCTANYSNVTCYLWLV